MQLAIYQPMWGRCGPGAGAATAEELVPALRTGGYAGLEGPSFQWGNLSQLPALLRDHNVAWIPLLFADGPDARTCADNLERQLADVAPCNPPLVNVHAGADRFDFAESVDYYRRAGIAARQAGLKVAHETHRSRPLFTPWHTKELVDAVPDLLLTADLSHWVTVMERFFDDADLAAVIDRVVHIHARVGHEQGPQVADPAAPEWARHLDQFEEWWLQVWRHQAARGDATSTLTPEFGPPPYQPVAPGGLPIGDFVASQDWLAKRERDRFTLEFAE